MSVGSPEPSQLRRDIIKATVQDAVADLLYYDRKEDSELPRGEIEAAIEAGEVTIDEMVEWFRAALQDQDG